MTTHATNFFNNDIIIGINGPGFFQILLPDRTIGYTRNSIFTLSATRQLVYVSNNGYTFPLVLYNNVSGAVENIIIPLNAKSVRVCLHGNFTSQKFPKGLQVLGKVKIAIFVSPSSLDVSYYGDDILLETADSGVPQVLQPGQNVAGTLTFGKTTITNNNALTGEYRPFINDTFVMGINGPGYFQIALPDGTTVYTRNSNFKLSSTGKIVYVSENKKTFLLQPVTTIPATAKTASIESDGSVSVQLAGGGSQVLGTLQIAKFISPTSLAISYYGDDILLETGGMQNSANTQYPSGSGTPQLLQPGQNSAGTLTFGKTTITNNNALTDEYRPFIKDAFVMGIDGPGYFQIALPDGTTGYTRNSNFILSSTGQVVYYGLQLQPTITIPTTARTASIESDGTLSIQLAGGGSQVLGTLQIAIFVSPSSLGQSYIGYDLLIETADSGAPLVLQPGQISAGIGAGTLTFGKPTKTPVYSIFDFDFFYYLPKINDAFVMGINGPGYFQILLPDGKIGYTRNSNFKLSTTGKLLYVSENKKTFLLQPEITIPATAKSAHVSLDGTVSIDLYAGGQQVVGQLQITIFVSPSSLDVSYYGDDILLDTAYSGAPQLLQPGVNGGGTLTFGKTTITNDNALTDEYRPLINDTFVMGINGPGYFQITLPDGTTGYTRNSNFKLSGTRKLLYVSENKKTFLLQPVITIPATAKIASIDSDGTVSLELSSGDSEKLNTKIQIALFPSPSSLVVSYIGDDVLVETIGSGESVLTQPNTGGAGGITQGISTETNNSIWSKNTSIYRPRLNDTFVMGIKGSGYFQVRLPYNTIGYTRKSTFKLSGLGKIVYIDTAGNIFPLVSEGNLITLPSDTKTAYVDYNGAIKYTSETSLPAQSIKIAVFTPSHTLTVSSQSVDVLTTDASPTSAQPNTDAGFITFGISTK